MGGEIECRTRASTKKRDSVTDSMEENVHEKVASYVQYLSGIYELKSPVWMEHSYAARSQETCKGRRSILMNNAVPCTQCQELNGSCDNCLVDVECFEKLPEFPISLEPTPHLDGPLTEDDTKSMSEDKEDEDDWEQNIYSLSQNPSQRLLAMEVLDIINSMRMWRLTDSSLNAGSVHARKLRRRLSNHWTDGSASWLHSALNAYLPRPYIMAYNEMLSQLQKKIPKLLERLPASHIPKGRSLIPLNCNKLESGTSLLLVTSGKPRLDARWHNALAYYFNVQDLPVPKIVACPVNDWIGSMYSSSKQALQSAPPSYVIAGVGPCGAALAIALAASSSSKATSLILISPALQTLAGPRGGSTDALLRLNIPTLFVVPQNGMQCMVADAEEVRSRMSCRTEVLAVGSSDDLIRFNSNSLRRVKATREMVEIAIAAQVHKFVTVEPPQANVQSLIEIKSKESRRLRDFGPPSKRLRSSVDRQASPSPPLKEHSTPSSDSTSSWPMSDLTPKKIMDLPIVFADDSQNQQHPTSESSTVSASPSPVPQQVRFRKVIVAKRPGNMTVTGNRLLRTSNADSHSKSDGKMRILPMRTEASPKQPVPLLGISGPAKITNKSLNSPVRTIIGTPSTIKIVNRSPNTKASPGKNTTISTPTSFKIVRQMK